MERYEVEDIASREARSIRSDLEYEIRRAIEDLRTDVYGEIRELRAEIARLRSQERE